MSARRATLILMLLFGSLFSNEEIAKTDPLAHITSLKTEDGYTINYNTVSIIEYIRFASKICKANFIYNESELNFTVTVVSDEPVTPANVMATLLQVLRIHGLLLLEQDNNLVIHKSESVKQIATLVTEGSQEGSAAIVTRIFRIKNAKPESLAAIIQPMISSSALLETSAETRQLILTDLKANVDKIAALIENLDSPYTLLDIKSFSVKYNKPDFLIELASQIMGPLAQGNPFILVPQNLAGQVFIVSTPDLTQKALAVLASLDSVPKLAPTDSEGSLFGDQLIHTQFYIYKPVHRTGEELSSALKEVTIQLKADKLADPTFMSALGTMKWVQSTNSLLFTGDPAALQKIQALIGTLDKPIEKGLPSYYIYKVQHTTGDVIEEDLDALAKNFKASGVKDPKLLEVIEKIRYVKQTNSLLMGGDPRAIEEVKALIAQYDYPRAATESNSFYMYKPHNINAGRMEKSLRDVATNLKKAGLADPALLRSIESMKYVDATNSLIFTGPSDALQKIQGLLKEIDVPSGPAASIQHVGKTTFLLYKLKHASGSQMVSSIKNIVIEMKKSGASDPNFLAALNSVKYIKETNSLFFTGTEDSLNKAQTLVEKFDVASAASSLPSAPGASNFFIYKPQSLSGPDLERLISEFAENLSSSGLQDPDLFSAIKSMRWTEKTNTLVFTGSPKALDQIKELLKDFDNASGTLVGGGESSIQSIENTNFLVYKLQFHKGDEIQTALRQIAKDLISSNAHINQGLLNSINSLQWLEVTNSLLCSGDPEVLTRLRELIKNLDIPLKQVFIEMLMIETTLSNALTFGLEWGANFKYRNKFSTNSYNTPPNLFTGGNSGSSAPAPDPFVTNLAGLNSTITPVPSKIPPPVSGFDLGVIGEVIKHNGQTFLTLGSLLSALQQDSEISVIMTPKIITQDGRTSKLFRGENIPFVGSFISNQGNNTINTSNIEYRDIGVNLTITPILGNSDIITLDISLDRSQTTGDITQASLQPGAQTANGIITSKTTMQTTVHVPDNNFLILTGMVNNSNAKVKAGIPCLGGLPLVGAFFSQNNDSITNSNIVIFIRPHIINSIEDMRSLSTKEEDYFRDQAGTPFLERGFDEGMELIKTVDDE